MLKLLVLLLACSLPGTLAALEAQDVKSALLKARPDLPIETIADSAIKGFYQIGLRGGHILQVTGDAKYFVAGDLFSVTADDLVNLTEKDRDVRRRELIASVQEKDMVIFAPKKPIKTVTVFTDIDCGYCQKLHREVPELNKMGIAIHYLAYPRAGIPSESYDKIASVWCSDDRQTALTKSKAGQAIPGRKCPNPVADQLALGEEIGVNGTPALVLDTGELVPGYLPAKELAARLGIN